MASETYTINGVSVKKYNPSDTSDKPPIIMVHGGNHAGWCCENWANFFSEAGYEVHVPDWYNHGESEKLPEEEYLKRSIVDVAHKEISYVAEKVGQTPIVIGHSMGGLASVAYAASNEVEKLILIAPIMPAAAHANPMPIPVDTTKPFPVFPYEQAKQFFFTNSTEEDAKRYYEKLEPESPQAVLEATRQNVELDPSAITVPTLVMATEVPGLIQREPLERYAALIHADFVQANGVGHSDVLLKDPEWKSAASQVLDWLSK